MSKTVSDQLVDALAAAGVERIYGIVGDSLNPVMEALREHEQLRWVGVRHEETAAFAASAEAQLSGRVAACCGSCGPGNMHLINGLYDAHRSCAPVFALASHIPTAAIGSDYFQETHPTNFFRECTRYCELASQAAQAPQVTLSALRAAVAGPGVGMAVLPGDVAAAPAADEKWQPAPPSPPDTLPEPGEAELRRMAGLINAAKRVTFFCGAGCAGAREELLELAKKVRAPIGYTLRAKDIMEADNPLGIGMSGLLGWGDATRALHEAELVVLWGTDFPYTSFLPEHGNVVQVDTRAEALGRRTRLCLAICADAAHTARRLLPLVHEDRGDEFLDRCLSRHGNEVTRLQCNVRYVDEGAPIRPEYLTRLVSDRAEPDAVFTVDTGTPVIWCARYVQGMPRRRILGSFKHGSMACALAMAIGAKAAAPARQVIALCGDGGLSMLPGDMLTLVQEGLAAKLLVYNNSSLDFVALEQEIIGMAHSGTALHPTNYADIARSMGLKAWRVQHAAELPSAVLSWLAAQGPALLDVVVDTHELALPPDTGMLQALGLTQALGARPVHHELDTLKRLLFGKARILDA